MKISEIIIKGFYGKNLNIKINNDLLILVGENGSGKTTLLRFIYFFLAKQWDRLTEFEFDEVKANINGKEYSLKQVEINSNTSTSPIILKKLSAQYPTFSNFILNEYPKHYNSNLMRDSFKINEISQIYDVPPSLIISISKHIFESRFNPNIFDWQTSIIFLPTYRKIEKGINILMGDIDDRIYSYILETIPHVKHVIEKQKEDEQGESILENDIKKIFSKINDDRNVEKWFKKQNTGIELLEFGMKDVQFRITYFLSVENTEKMNIIQKFTAIINKYLGSNKCIEISEDGNISIKSNDNIISDLESLSSGEKQIVSIFSHIYFNTNDVYVVIDEPELSLSIKWQEYILEDLINSSAGVICATHSPFIISSNFHKNTSGVNELSRQ